MRVALILPALFAASLAAADTCPQAPDHEAELAELFDQIRVAPDERAGRLLSDRMWALWTDAPDAKAQGMLDLGMSRREVYDFEGALAIFDGLVNYCPDYAEGYNQRAFIYFLLQDFPKALENLDQALDRSPRHVGALSGKALTLMGLGRSDEAQAVLVEAVRLNPWLPERGLLQTPVERDL
jgi:Lipoprotein NlpI, contains TPR repeats